MNQPWLDQLPIRQALQAGLGVAIAMGVGTLISGQRWYWAVIAAFIVSIGVGSRLEAAVKALQRLAGTLVGIVVGIFLASAVSGHTNLALGLVLVCVFFAFYAFQTAYGVMTFCITVMLALLYGLMGQFQPHLLVLRLEETAAGAAVGVLVTAFVLPTRQNDALRDTTRDFLDALANAIRQSAAGDPNETRKAVFDLRAKTQALRNSIAAAKRGWVPLIGLPYRRAVRAAMRCAYLAREMAQRGRVTEEQATMLLDEIAFLRSDLDGRLAPTTDNSEMRPSEDRLFTAMLEAIHRLRELLVAALEGR